MFVFELEVVFGSPSPPPPPSLLKLFVFIKSEDLENSDEDDDPNVKVDKDAVAVGGGIDATVDGAVDEKDEPKRDVLFISVGAASFDPESTRENGTDVETFSL